MEKNIVELLAQRGYIYQSTNLDAVKKLLNEKKITFYLGIDPTADSLHIGHFFALMMFKHLQEAGHKGILVIGGATALIGDPSGKSDMRKMITKETVAKNIAEIKALAKRFIKTDGENPAIILDNAEWFKNYDYIDFMRDVGIHFNVTKMLSADAYANRIKEGGLTFLEMGYMLMQAYDFVYLNKKYGCVLEIGGSDQWGNIVAGTNLFRKMQFVNNEEDAEEIFGLTSPLLMNKDGKKMGKTEKGTLWVARDKTTPYDFYQYFYNIEDENVEMLLKLFTNLELDYITSIINSDIIKAKKVMAFEITKLVHGEEEANKAVQIAQSFFGQANLDNCPAFNLSKTELLNGVNFIDLVVRAGLATTKSEVRRLIEQNGISLNNEKVTDIYRVMKNEDFNDEVALIQKGKKAFAKIQLK